MRNMQFMMYNQMQQNSFTNKYNLTQNIENKHLKRINSELIRNNHILNQNIQNLTGNFNNNLQNLLDLNQNNTKVGETNQFETENFHRDNKKTEETSQSGAEDFHKKIKIKSKSLQKQKSQLKKAIENKDLILRRNFSEKKVIQNNHTKSQGLLSTKTERSKISDENISKVCHETIINVDNIKDDKSLDEVNVVEPKNNKIAKDSQKTIPNNINSIKNFWILIFLLKTNKNLHVL